MLAQVFASVAEWRQIWDSAMAEREKAMQTAKRQKTEQLVDELEEKTEKVRLPSSTSLSHALTFFAAAADVYEYARRRPSPDRSRRQGRRRAQHVQLLPLTARLPT